MDKVTIRRLADSELEEFRTFCESAWKSKHPLIHDEQLFEYYYRRDDGLINFAVAKDDETGEFLSVCGFICASSSPTPDVWISFIVTKKGAPFGLGFKLLEQIRTLTSCRTIGCNNIRENTRNLYEFFGYYVGELAQYYRYNDSLHKYTMCNIVSPDILSILPSTLEFIELKSESELECFNFEDFHENKPYKDSAYAKKRFFENRGLDYKIYAAKECGHAVALLVLRVVRHESSCVVRVVDFIGDTEYVSGCGQFLDRLMHELDAEFCDWYAFGVDKSAMASAGLSLRQKGDINIVPNYLNPPLMENTDYFFFTSDPSNYTMFKADGDQDRARLDSLS